MSEQCLDRNEINHWPWVSRCAEEYAHTTKHRDKYGNTWEIEAENNQESP